MVANPGVAVGWVALKNAAFCIDRAFGVIHAKAASYRIDGEETLIVSRKSDELSAV